MKKKIVITGGTGRFGEILKKYKNENLLFFPNKKELDILDYKKIVSYFAKTKPDILIHLAGLSRPMSIHEKDIKKSIDLNIIGTANITKACEKKKIKLIYFSTHYIYSGTKGNYKETDSILPVNNYAWSKLGGEASVNLYKNSLILRLCMTEKPFVHKKAFSNVKTNFLFHEDVVPIIFQLLDCKGIINIGGKKQTIYNFAKNQNKKIKRAIAKKNQIPLNSTLDLKKMNLALKNSKLN